MARQKTRTDHLVAVHERLREARTSIAMVDLRTLRAAPEVRDEIKGLRDEIDAALARSSRVIAMEAPLATAM